MEINRVLEKSIIERLIPGKVNLLLGTRRTGKSFLLKKIVQETTYKTLVLQGEDNDTILLFGQKTVVHYQRILQNIELLIIDEAQEIPEIGLILKLIVDNVANIRILVTGSSAFDLANVSGEPLTGRVFYHEIYPIAQLELQPYQNALQTIQDLDQRLLFGSYPELWNLNPVVTQQEYLTDLVNSYLLKDIVAFEGIRNSSKIKDLLRLIAYQIGKEVSLEELAKQLQLSRNTVEKYLDLCSKVFILKKIEAYSGNLRKEITKTARWYFWDLGIRNTLINDFRPIVLRNDIGQLWENYLVIERLKKQKYTKQTTDNYFWRTYDQQEIDWIELQNGQLCAYEFKWGDNKSIKPPKAFAKAYPNASFEVINKENYLGFIRG